MKPVPTDPRAFEARVMDALIGDILDSGQKGFVRLDALRAAMNAEPAEQKDEALRQWLKDTREVRI